jgi:hypothetical protein
MIQNSLKDKDWAKSPEFHDILAIDTHQGAFFDSHANIFNPSAGFWPKRHPTITHFP